MKISNTSKSSVPTLFDSEICIFPDRYQCGGNYTTDTGLLASPDFPRNVIEDITCAWTITVASQHFINLKFLASYVHYITDCLADFVEVSIIQNPQDLRLYFE